MNLAHASCVTACLASMVLGGCKSNERSEPTAQAEPAAQTPLTVEDSVDVNVTANVSAIDHATRWITLEDEQGHRVSFFVDDSVRRLNEVSPGDRVNARYRAHLLAELRPATAEEKANPIAAVGVAGRTPQGDTPAAGVGQAIRVVTTVASVDVPNMLVTLRGPMGDLSLVHARNPDNVSRLKVGDTIVITYSESIAVALEKVAPR